MAPRPASAAPNGSPASGSRKLPAEKDASASAKPRYAEPRSPPARAALDLLRRVAEDARVSLLLLAAAGFAALSAALIAEHVFGLLPCALCLMQRYPYAMVAALGLPALLRLPPWLATLLLSFDALAMLSNAVIASYHVGVEQHWWTDELTCGAAADGLSLMEPTAIRCDEVPWELFGISMAGYNVPASLAMAGFAGAAAWYSRS